MSGLCFIKWLEVAFCIYSVSLRPHRNQNATKANTSIPSPCAEKSSPIFAAPSKASIKLHIPSLDLFIKISPSSCCFNISVRISFVTLAVSFIRSTVLPHLWFYRKEPSYHYHGRSPQKYIPWNKFLFIQCSPENHPQTVFTDENLNRTTFKSFESAPHTRCTTGPRMAAFTRISS